MLRLVEEQEQSGQSQIEFCKNQNLSIATFGYWHCSTKKYMIMDIRMNVPIRGWTNSEVL